MEMISNGFDSNISTTENIIETSTTNFTSPILINVDLYLQIYAIVVPTIGILIIIINLAIVVTSGLILHNGQEPQTTYAFLGNVALSDLVLGIIILFGMYYPEELRTEMSCCVIVGTTISSSLASVYSIMLIAIDRYLYILHGLRYENYLTMTRVRIAILLIWILSLTIGLLPVMGYRNPTYNKQFCWVTILAPPTFLFISTSIGIIPLVVILVLYSIILQKALSKIAERRASLKKLQNLTQITVRNSREQLNSIESNRCLIPKFISNRFRKSEHDKLPPVYNPSKWRAIKIVLLTTGCFFCTWFPFFFASILYLLCNPFETPKYCDNLRIVIASPLAILGVSNSILNPIIYAWWHNGFRKSVIKIYRKLFRREINY